MRGPSCPDCSAWLNDVSACTQRQHLILISHVLYNLNFLWLTTLNTYPTVQGFHNLQSTFGLITWIKKHFPLSWSSCKGKSLVYLESFWPEWCISTIYHAWDTSFWSGTLNLSFYCMPCKTKHGLWNDPVWAVYTGPAVNLLRFLWIRDTKQVYMVHNGLTLTHLLWPGVTHWY